MQDDGIGSEDVKRITGRALASVLVDLARDYKGHPEVFDDPEVAEAEKRVDEAMRSGSMPKALAEIEVYERVYRKAMKRIGAAATCILIAMLCSQPTFAASGGAEARAGRVDENPFHPGAYRVFDRSEKPRLDVEPNPFREGEYRLYDKDSREYRGRVDSDGDLFQREPDDVE